MNAPDHIELPPDDRTPEEKAAARDVDGHIARRTIERLADGAKREAEASRERARSASDPAVQAFWDGRADGLEASENELRVVLKYGRWRARPESTSPVAAQDGSSVVQVGSGAIASVLLATEVEALERAGWAPTLWWTSPDGSTWDEDDATDMALVRVRAREAMVLPAEEAPDDGRWLPGAVWEHTSGGGHRMSFALERLDTEPCGSVRWAYFRDLSICAVANMTEANGWRFIGRPAGDVR